MDKQIIKIEELAEKIKRIVIKSEYISRKALPGQFVLLMVNEKSERIPLTVVLADKDEGTITLIFQEAGFSTNMLGQLKVGDILYSLTGPLGRATNIANLGKIMLVAGGVGIAEIYPVAKAFKAAGCEVFVVIGARSKELLILQQELEAVADELVVVTDDGSYGEKAYTTDVTEKVLQEAADFKLVYCVGPIIMMRKISEITSQYGVKTLVSLNTLMVDGTGMCGCCRVTVNGVVKFACVDGPEFDASLIDWQELIQRNSAYMEQQDHICKLTDKEGGL